MKRKIIALALSLVLMFSGLSACGVAEKESSVTESEVSTTDENEALPNEDESTVEVEEEPTENNDSDEEQTEAVVSTFSDNGKMRKSLTATEFTRLMGNGINLGNTLEATGRTKTSIATSVSSCETAWGQPITTKEMIFGMKESGFDTLRIPVAWTNMMDFTNGDYTISEEYLARVKEVVDYAREAGMYVIINDHWDMGWWGLFGAVNEEGKKDLEKRNMAWEIFENMWTQIAEYFKDYSDYLVFECGNEELGNRFNDADWTGIQGKLSENECFDLNAKVNQKFVNIVRKSGGNNKHRFLLISGFNTDIGKTCDYRFCMPQDKVSDKLLISVHFYDPNAYCLNGSVSQWGTTVEMDAMEDTLVMMNKFVDEGIGVVIGEYGALPKWENGQSVVKENTLEYTKYMLDICDIYNFCPVLWDTGGLYVKSEKTMAFEDLTKLFVSRNAKSEKKKTVDEITEIAKADKQEMYANPLEKNYIEVDSSVATAWIMWNSADWNTTYSVGDTYDPNSKTDGIVAKDVVLTGEGSYTVSLDFTETASGYSNDVVFAALGVYMGDVIYTGWAMDIKEIKINGEKYDFQKGQYTTTDDGQTLRINLYNQWITKIPDNVRTVVDGDVVSLTAADSKNKLSASIIEAGTLGNVSKIEITFDFVDYEHRTHN